MKKIKIEVPCVTNSGKIARVILYAEADGNIAQLESVKKILEPQISVVDTPETAAGQDAKI